MERYIRVNLLGPGPRRMKKNLPGRGLTKVEKQCSRRHKLFPSSGPSFVRYNCTKLSSGQPGICSPLSYTLIHNAHTSTASLSNNDSDIYQV